MSKLRPNVASGAPRRTLTRTPFRILQGLAVTAGLLLTTGFESPERINEDIIKPMPREFRLVVIEGGLQPAEARFRRSGNTYVNEAPDTDGSNVMRASWFAVHRTDSDAVLIEYPAVSSTGQTVYRIEYALEVDRNRYQMYELNESRLAEALDRLESAVRRGDASRGERRRYERMTEIWNTHVTRDGGAPSDHFHITNLDDINAIIDFSRRLDGGEKVITSNGDLIELYIR